jgi:hypothetical protein
MKAKLLSGAMCAGEGRPLMSNEDDEAAKRLISIEELIAFSLDRRMPGYKKNSNCFHSAAHFAKARRTIESRKMIKDRSLRREIDKYDRATIMAIVIIIAIVIFMMCIPIRIRASDLPKRSLTPGAVDPSVTQSNIQTTICKPGYTATVRPSESYTNRIKKQLLPLYGYHNANPLNFELDHLIPLEIGGAPRDVKNLWPQPYAGKLGARVKDVLETGLNRKVCSGDITLANARYAIAHDWPKAYRKYVTH